MNHLIKYAAYLKESSGGISRLEDSAVDLNFIGGLYYTDSVLRSTPTITSYHQRASAAYGEHVDGSFELFSVDTPRILPNIGYVVEDSATGLVDFTEMRTALYVVGGMVANFDGTYLGIFNKSVRISSNGETWHRHKTEVLMDLAVGEKATITAFVRKGTSNKFKMMLDVTPDGEPVRYVDLSGDIDSLPASTTSRSEADIYHVSTELRADGTYKIKLLVEAKKNLSDVRVGVGPDTTVNGGDIILCGLDVKEGPIFSSPCFGARAMDGMKIPAVDNGLNFTQGALFLKIRLLEQPDTGFPRFLALGGTYDNSIRFTRDNPANSVLIGTRVNGATGVLRSGGDPSYLTMGFAWREDGSARLKIGDNQAYDHTGYVANTVNADLFIGASTLNSGGCNCIIEEVVGFDGAISEDKFDNIFAEVAA